MLVGGERAALRLGVEVEEMVLLLFCWCCCCKVSEFGLEKILELEKCLRASLLWMAFLMLE